jgi:beta-lactamase class A
VLKRLDQGKEKLDRFVSHGAKDILEYALVTKAHLNKGGMRLGDLCAAAIEQSDNTAGNLLFDAIGGPAELTDFARSRRDEVTRLDRKEPELNSAVTRDERETTTAAAKCTDMQRLLLGNVLSESSRHQLEDCLQKNETGASMIRASVPKSGALETEPGDAATEATNDYCYYSSTRTCTDSGCDLLKEDQHPRRTMRLQSSQKWRARNFGISKVARMPLIRGGGRDARVLLEFVA